MPAKAMPATEGAAAADSSSATMTVPAPRPSVIGAYKTPLMGIAELGLVAAVVFHAFNGLRIILVDFWGVGTRHQKAMFYIVIALSVVVMAAFTPRHLISVFGG